MKRILTTCTAVLLGTAAFAAPVAAADDIWSGAYAGGVYALASGTNIYAGDDPYSLEGSAYGVFAGYRRGMGDFLLGGEVASLIAGGVFETDELPRYHYNSIVDLKATVGYDLGSALVYAAAGYSLSSFDEGDAINTMAGWLFGAGVDVKVGERFFVGAEYIYRDMKNDDFWGVDDGLEGQVSTAQIRAGVNF